MQRQQLERTEIFEPRRKGRGGAGRADPAGRRVRQHASWRRQYCPLARAGSCRSGVRPCPATERPGLIPAGQRGTVRGFTRSGRTPAALGGQLEAVGGRLGEWGSEGEPGVGGASARSQRGTGSPEQTRGSARGGEVWGKTEPDWAGWGVPKNGESGKGEGTGPQRPCRRGNEVERPGAVSLARGGGPAGVLWLKPWGPLRLAGFLPPGRALLKSQRGHLHGSVGSVSNS